MSYEGWRNYHTWNVALWLSNEEAWYMAMVDYLTEYPESTYLEMVERLQAEYILGQITPDNVAWADPTLDEEELNRFLDDFRPEKVA